MHILITGASGSGATTLGLHFCSTKGRGWRFFDTDYYYWLPDLAAYRTKRDPALRLSMLAADLAAAKNSVTSGSLMGWGRALEDAFDLIVFLYLDKEIRLERLRRREQRELGFADPAFLQWAANYDKGAHHGRSLAKHRAWLAERSCPVLEIKGRRTTNERGRSIEAFLADFPAA